MLLSGNLGFGLGFLGLLLCLGSLIRKFPILFLKVFKEDFSLYGDPKSFPCLTHHGGKHVYRITSLRKDLPPIL